MAIRRIKELYERHERLIMISGLIGGFIFDNLTLRRIDYLSDFLVLAAYLIVATVSIVAINVVEERFYNRPKILRLHSWLVFLTQFAFGALWSGFTVFYTRSA